MQDIQLIRFLNVLKQLHINIPLVEALEKMLNFEKFMKDISSKKRRLGEFETVAPTEGCTTMLTDKLPLKLKDEARSWKSKTYYDYVATECKADQDVPIILGRPFLATGKTLIDVQNGELTMRVNDQQVTFTIFNSLKCADVNDECHAIGLIETALEEFTRFSHKNSDSDEDSLE
ncbi:uncharacterized protein LOC105775424 [Gossypium raimondii]|uniref:uncharacterized protein LOC105775424 n=1 Tax=Gossypium raimondii TaxID=29730 RepID=UPI00063A8BAB|nr:uncharacterized protein LOC105775424 [Gossypium raimondii]